MTKSLNRLPIVQLASAALIGFATASEEKAPNFVIPEETQILLENHCFDCHDDIEQKGDIRLDHLAELETPKRLDLLNRMQEQIYFQQMPPQKSTKLTCLFAVSTIASSLFPGPPDPIRLFSATMPQIIYSKHP